MQTSITSTHAPLALPCIDPKEEDTMSVTNKNRLAGRYCAYCATVSLPLSLCAQCKRADVQIWYCSASCQENDWKEHRKTCGSVDRQFSKLLFDGTLSDESVEDMLFDGPLNIDNTDLEASLNREVCNASPRASPKVLGKKRSRSPAAPAPFFALLAPVKAEHNTSSSNNAASKPFGASSLFWSGSESVHFPSLFNSDAGVPANKRRKTNSEEEERSAMQLISQPQPLIQSSDLYNSAGALDFASIAMPPVSLDYIDAVRAAIENKTKAGTLARPIIKSEKVANPSTVNNNNNKNKNNNNNNNKTNNTVNVTVNAPTTDIKVKKEQGGKRPMTLKEALAARAAPTTFATAVFHALATPPTPPPMPSAAPSNGTELEEALEDSQEDATYHPPTARRFVHRRTRTGEKPRAAKLKKLKRSANRRANSTTVTNNTPLTDAQRISQSIANNNTAPARGRESRAKRLKRQQYGTLSMADLATLGKLGVDNVADLVPAFRKCVDQVTYLHTRRQHIVNWLATTALFPLLSWDYQHIDEFGQPTLRLNVPRADVHKALKVLLKCEPTEWLFKRVRHATTAEGHWLFKRGQHRLLLEHAAKAVGRTLDC